MRLKITLTPSNSEAKLDINYNYYLAALIFNVLKKVDKNLSLELHRPMGPKFFTFSKLFTKSHKIDGEKIVFEDSAHFFISSPKNEIPLKLAEGLLTDPEVKLNGESFLVSEIGVLEEKSIGSREKFVTMSPVYASSIEESGAVKRCIDL